MAGIRWNSVVVGVCIVFVVVLFNPAAARLTNTPVTGPTLREQALVNAVLIAALGSIYVAMAADTTTSVTEQILGRPLTAFGVGMLGLFGLVVVVFALALIQAMFFALLGTASTPRVGSGVGMIRAVLAVVPVVLGLTFVAVFGYLPIGRAVTTNWLPAIGVGATAAGVVSIITVVGWLLALGAVVFGLGGVILQWSGPSRRRQPTRSPKRTADLDEVRRP